MLTLITYYSNTVKPINFKSLSHLLSYLKHTNHKHQHNILINHPSNPQPSIYFFSYNELIKPKPKHKNHAIFHLNQKTLPPSAF